MLSRNVNVIIAIILSMVLLVGCTNNNAASDSDTDMTESNLANNESNSSDESSPSSSTENVADTYALTTNAVINAEFDTDDYYTGEIPQNATTIALNKTSVDIIGLGASAEGGNITISSDGVFVISGTLENGQIIVNAGEKDDIQLIFNGLSLHCSDNAPIYIQSADKVVISLHGGSVNTLSDTENYVLKDIDSEEPNATIFSKADLIINGSGTLIIEANYNNAITSKDDLKIVDAILQITSVDDGILGRDMVAVKDSDITIEAGGDGMKATNDAETAKGYITVDGGSLNITAGTDGIQAITSILISRGTLSIASFDDAIHSNNIITISSGTITISAGDDGLHADTEIKILGGNITIMKSYEGMESALITMEEGVVSVTSSDDGINVTDGANASSTDGAIGPNSFPGESSSNGSFTINGGILYVDADGDGLDSNGSIYITGGTILVNGPTNDGNGPMDYQGSCEITGGFLIASGSSGMAQAPDETSAQYSIGVLFTQRQSAGTLIHIKDGSGTELVTFAPSKEFSSFVISSPEIKSGETYTIFTGGSSTGTVSNGLYTGGAYKAGNQMVEFTLSDVVTWVNESGITTYTGGFGGKGGGMGGFGGRDGSTGGFGGGKRGN